MVTPKLEQGRWFGPVYEAIVASAEESLGVALPEQYRDFLLRYGSGLVGSYEIYGLGGPPNRVPSLLWLIEDLQRSGLHRPKSVIPFHAEGDGDYSAVLAEPLCGQPAGAVVYWSPRQDDVLDVKPAYASLNDWFAERAQ